MHIANNYWMCENIRQEPVLSLANNNNNTFAAHTDSFLPLPNGGGPNHLNSYLSSQNTVSSSHQIGHQINGHQKSQYMWPSSHTFRSPYANNFQASETYSGQNTGLNLSTQNSQVHQNYYSKHLSPNLNFAQVFSSTSTNNTVTNTYTNNNINCFNNNNNNNDKYRNSVQAKSSSSNTTPISRIRVRDVYSLNNSALHTPLLINNVPQIHQKEPTECTLNHMVMNNSASFGVKIPAEYVDYEKVNLFHSNHVNPPCGYTAITQAKPNNPQKLFQPSELCYQKKIPMVTEKVEKTFSHNSVTEPSSNPQKNCEAGIPNIQQKSCDAPFKSKRVKVQPKRNSSELSNLQNLERVSSFINREKAKNINCTDSLKASEGMRKETEINKNSHSRCHYQKNLSDFDKGSSVNQASPSEKLRKCRKSKQCNPSNQKSSNDQMEAQQNNLVKITIPHTGQSSFIRLDYSDIEANSTSNLICLSELQNPLLNQLLSRKGPDQNHSKTENNGVVNSSLGQINQGNSIDTEVRSTNTNPVCSKPGLIENRDSEVEKIENSFPLRVKTPEKLKMTNEALLSEERLIGFKEPKNSQNSGEISENISEDVDSIIEKKSQSTEAVSHDVAIKQENLESEAELPIDPEDRMLKTQNSVDDIEMREQDSPISENNVLENTPLVDNTEFFDFSKVNADNPSAKKLEPESEVMTHALENSEKSIQELNDSSTKEKASFPLINKMKNTDSKLQNLYQPRRTYKSGINKEKLFLLLKFLNSDGDPVEMYNSEKTGSSEFLEEHSLNNKEEKKLNKTWGGKNKNNCKEVISEISDNDPRMEIFKCSSKNPQIGQTVKSSVEGAERPEADSSVVDRNVDFSESHDEIINNFQDNPVQEDNCSESELENVNLSACKQKQDASEKCLSEKESSTLERNDINSAFQTFQNLKTHYCMSCQLMSSIDSFWINVASGELRCLNCFKKMLMKTKEHVLKPELEEVGGKDNSKPKVQKREANRSTKKNKGKSGFENSCDGLISALGFEYDHQKTNENIQKEVKEAINVSSKGDITFENDEEMTIKSKCCTVSRRKLPRSSKTKSEEDKKLLRKAKEKLTEWKVNEILRQYAENLKLEQMEAARSKVLNTENQTITEINEKSEKIDAVPDESQNSGPEALPTKSEQINDSNEKLNQEEKVASKEKSVSLKARLLKNYNEENSSLSKNDFGASCDTDGTLTLMEDVKSNKKFPSKEETNKIEREQNKKNWNKIEENSIDMPNQNGKRTSGSEEVACPKLQTSKEHSKEEVMFVDSMNESMTKPCPKESFASQKSHSLEDNAKRDSKCEPLDKIKVQKSLKEIDFEQKSRISEKEKRKETDVMEKSKRKCLFPQKITERRKKEEWVDHPSKRQCLDKGYDVHKVCLVEENAKREIKPVTPSYDRSKEDNADRMYKTLDHEKQTEKDSWKRSRSCSREGNTSFENSVRKETSHASAFSEKRKARRDFYNEKANVSDHSDPPSEVRRRRNKVKCSCLKPDVTKKRFENKNKNQKSKLSNDLRRSSFSKEDSDSFSEPFSMETAEYKENKTEEEKERKQFREKIPKKSHSRWNVQFTDGFRSLSSYGSEDKSNVKEKNEQRTRIREDCRDKKSICESFNSNKESENTKNLSNKEGKEMFQKMSDTKSEKKTENDLNERKDRRSHQMQGSVGQYLKEKTFECSPEKKKEDVAPRKSRQNSDRESEKSKLLMEHSKKTKKSS